MVIFALILVLSLIIGSFLNVVIYRLPRAESIVWPGSHCMACGHALGVLDLIPIMSYLFLHGKCRYCGENISFHYPLVETLTALTFLLIYIKGGFSVWTLAGCIFTSILIVAAFTDIDEGIIPDLVTYPGVLLGIILSPLNLGLKSSLLGTFFWAFIFLLIVIISRGGMGGGDVKLAAVIGAFTGLKGALLVFILSSVMGGIWALLLILCGRADRKTAIKFGPFLSLAGFLTWNWQLEIFDYYWRLFG